AAVPDGLRAKPRPKASSDGSRPAPGSRVTAFHESSLYRYAAGGSRAECVFARRLRRDSARLEALGHRRQPDRVTHPDRPALDDDPAKPGVEQPPQHVLSAHHLRQVVARLAALLALAFDVADLEAPPDELAEVDEIG